MSWFGTNNKVAYDDIKILQNRVRHLEEKARDHDKVTLHLEEQVKELRIKLEVILPSSIKPTRVQANSDNRWPSNPYMPVPPYTTSDDGATTALIFAGMIIADSSYNNSSSSDSNSSSCDSSSSSDSSSCGGD